MARTGMANPILHLRQMTNAGTADYTVAGTSYWSDDHLQATLDRYRVEYRNLLLVAIPEYYASSYYYLDYDFSECKGDVEENAAGSGWALRDSNGNNVSSSSYSVNYQAKVITFNTNTQNAYYLLSCRCYNMELAAADIWDQRASFEQLGVEWESDNMRVSGVLQGARDMAKHYRAIARPWSARWLRSDEA